MPFLEQTIRQVLRHEEMAPRHNACRVMQRVPDAARASKAHKPEHKQLAQRGSSEQRPPLLQTDVDAVHVTLLRVSLRRSAAAEHDLPALHAASRRPAVQGMHHQLCRDPVFASEGKRRMGFQVGDERVALELPLPAIATGR